MLTGIFILGEIRGDVGDRLARITSRYDPKLARSKPPHVTVTGSSGIGSISPDVPVSEIARRLEPLAEEIAPVALRFEPPTRFMQSNIIVLPLDPHGPLRSLHERIGGSGLPFRRARYTFTPHVTLSLYPTLDQDAVRELLDLRVTDLYQLDSLQVYLTRDPQPARKLLELPLAGVRKARR